MPERSDLGRVDTMSILPRATPREVTQTSLGRACVVCQDNDDLLLECADGQLRCPPCMVDAGWCLSCGSKITGGARPELSLCGQCSPEEWS
jgi:hypothetical protein